MNSDTLKSRLLVALQRLRKMQRMYSSMLKDGIGLRRAMRPVHWTELVDSWLGEGELILRSADSDGQERERSVVHTTSRSTGLSSGGGRESWLKSLQAQPLADLFAELVGELSRITELPMTRVVAEELFVILDRYQFRSLAAREVMDQKSSALLRSAQSGEYVRSALLSEELVALRAFMQACETIVQEMSGIVKQSRLTRPNYLSAPAGVASARASRLSEPAAPVASELKTLDNSPADFTRSKPVTASENSVAGTGSVQESADRENLARESAAQGNAGSSRVIPFPKRKFGSGR